MSMLHLLVADTASVTLLLALTVLLFVFLIVKPSAHKGKYTFPPGPRPWPIVGNLHLLDGRRPQESFDKLAQQYGDVFTFHMGSQKYIILTGYAAVKEALLNQAEAFGERAQTPFSMKMIKGKGIVFGSGESWRTMRRFALSTLRDFGMGRSTIEDRIVDESQRLLDVFDQYKGKPFNPITPITSAASNIICHLVFGRRFEYDDQQFLRLHNIISENVQLLSSKRIQIFNLFPRIAMFFSGFKKILNNMEETRDFIREESWKRKNDLDHNDLRSFMDSFLAKQQEESKNPNTYFDEENMLASTANLFGAGTETTSTTLRWGMLVMMKYPHIQEKVHAEIDRVIGRDRLPRQEDRKNMPYTDAVVHEIQRFGDVLPLNLLHETKMDTTFRGYNIPQGTPVIPLLSSVLYDKTQWKTPRHFNPEHFLDDEGRFVKRDAFLPFSAGRRVCVGETLAKMEIFLFFTALLQRFRIQPPAGVRPDDLELTATIGITSAPTSYELCALRR